MYIRNVTIKNIRCFKKLTLSFDLSGECPPWTVLVGDNATGKTTLLRSIAIGLCDETSAAALMKESDEGYIRRGENEAAISIELKSQESPEKRYRIYTSIKKVKTGSGHHDKVKQTITPRNDRRWDELFACAYGAGRGTAGAGDVVGWSILNAVYNLFNYSEGLQNPELTILRQGKPKQKAILSTLGDILLADQDALHMKRSGMTANGPWGKDMPIRDLADGYRSSHLWITDMLGWAFAKTPQLSTVADLTGIVLIDELEQHLHPKWQRTVVDDLRGHFPRMQFIATTHSPLIASSIGQVRPGAPPDRLIYLELTPGNEVKSSVCPTLRGWRADQVLASRAFDYVLTEDSEVNQLLKEACRLSSKRGKRSAAEESRYRTLSAQIARQVILDGETDTERELQEQFVRFLRQRIPHLEMRRREGGS